MNGGFVFKPTKPEVACQCGECEPHQRFLCRHCLRRVPWCFGSDDAQADLCDECAWQEEVPLGDS